MYDETDRCWKCGYDLSRAGGDYVRCPECGMVTNRLTAARDLERWRVRRWTRWMAGCCVALCVVTPALALMQSGLIAIRIEVHWWWLMLVAVSLLGAGVVWVVARAMTPGERRAGKGVDVACASLVLGVGVAAVGMCILWSGVWFLLSRGG